MTVTVGRPIPAKKVYGLLAEFEHANELLEAARKAREAGYRAMDAYSPIPVHGLSEELGNRKTKLPLIVLCAGIAGATIGFFMQWYTSVIDYPLNIGGRPYNSWPYFIVITFEMTVLFAGLAAVVGMLVLNGLPQPYHPIFNSEAFGRASEDRFFLCIEARDPKFDEVGTREFLRSLEPHEVHEVPVRHEEDYA